MKKLVPQKLKNLYHLAEAILANVVFGFPSRKIKVIGVTGTNGKTTTVQMITKILEEAGKKVAMASTINFKIGDKEWVNATKFTTLSAFQVQKFIQEAVENSCEYLVLETSSHSLDQYRVWGVRYRTAVITNVTREHLDYHKTMEAYRQTKLKLFKKAKAAVVNLDMEKPDDFLEYTNEKKYIYTCHPERIRQSSDESKDLIELDSSTTLGMTVIKAENLVLGNNKTSFVIDGVVFQLNLLGEFNVENALAAIGAGLAEGISLETAARALEKIKGVPGRLEYVPNGKGFNIIIDYAVTPDSLEKLYTLLAGLKTSHVQKGHPMSKIIAVFGSCGERDRGKRPMMGEIVSRYADYIIVTNEDPYNEDPMQIIDEVVNGVKNKNEGENFWKILDRREAIRKALTLAKSGDFVVVTGKGAEETMAIGKKRIPWNDKEVILEELQKI